jgi:hypothetical protein
VAGNYDAIAATHKEEQLAGALKDQPDLADYMAQSEAHAALVKGDVRSCR